MSQTKQIAEIFAQAIDGRPDLKEQLITLLTGKEQKKVKVKLKPKDKAKQMMYSFSKK